MGVYERMMQRERNELMQRIRIQGEETRLLIDSRKGKVAI